MDLAELRIAARHLLGHCKVTANIDQEYYPEVLGKLYFVNGPWIFHTLWNAFKPALDARTQDKVHILGEGFQQDLLAEFNAADLPPEYGGLCDCNRHVDPQGELGCIPCQRPIVYDTVRTRRIAAGATEYIEIPWEYPEDHQSQQLARRFGLPSDSSGNANIEWEVRWDVVVPAGGEVEVWATWLSTQTSSSTTWLPTQTSTSATWPSTETSVRARAHGTPDHASSTHQEDTTNTQAMGDSPIVTPQRRAKNFDGKAVDMEENRHIIYPAVVSAEEGSI
eukprot:g31100.t1